jgi:protein-histidine N-methyltransferase
VEDIVKPAEISYIPPIWLPGLIAHTQPDMSDQFSFSFGGDDIEEDELPVKASTPAETAATKPAASAGAFPVAGKPLLPPIYHGLKQLLAQLPSKIAYGTVDVDLDGRGIVQLPRRELWDVRLQLMAEDDTAGEAQPGLGDHDVKTGVYEGGFKSWESSVDLVKCLFKEHSFLFSKDAKSCVLEVRLAAHFI